MYLEKSLCKSLSDGLIRTCNLPYGFGAPGASYSIEPGNALFDRLAPLSRL